MTKCVKPARRATTVERQRAPFDGADTDWGRLQERRHRENIARFERGDKRFDSLEELGNNNRKLILENTELTRGIDATLKQLIEDTFPYVALRRAVAKGGRGASRLGRFGVHVADWLLRIGKGGAVLLAIWFVFYALVHGASPGQALSTLWKLIR